MGDWDHADEMDRKHWDDDLCPHCKKPLVLPVGRRGSDVLIMGEFPGRVEVEQGIPMVGPMGAMLETELHFLGIRMRDLRRCNLWMHEKPEKLTPADQACFEYSLERAIREASNKRLILLMGSEVVEFFTGKPVMSMSGLLVKSDYFPNTVLVASVNPAIVFHSGVGEMRHALEIFKRELDVLDA